MQIKINYQITDEDADVIIAEVRKINSPFLGGETPVSFIIQLINEEHKMEGGIIAWMRPGIHLLCIDWLWIPEHLRKKGYGTKLVLAAENEGLKAGCSHSQLETLPFQHAVPFYQNLGYAEIGRLKGFYGDHDAIYMRKNLKTSE